MNEFNPSKTAIQLMEPGRDALIFENNCEDQIYNEVLLFKKNPENNSAFT